MKRIIVVSILFAATTSAVLAQSGFDASERGQFLGEGKAGPRMLSSTGPSDAILLGVGSSPNGVNGVIRYAREQGKMLYIISGMTGRSNTGANSLGGSLFASMGLDMNLMDFKSSVCAGFDHSKPNSNDGYGTLSLTRNMDRFELTVSGSYVTASTAGVSANGAVGDVAIGTAFSGVYVEGGYITPSRATGVYDAYLRGSIKSGSSKLRVKYGNRGVWAVDVAMPWGSK